MKIRKVLVGAVLVVAGVPGRGALQHPGRGHTWPGGKPLPEWRVGRNSNGIDATSLTWEFFREHPRGERPGARIEPD